MEFIALLWNEAIVRPLINSLLLLYVLLFSNFGLAIIALTFVIKGLTYPLTLKSLRQTQKMQGMQIQVKAVQDRFKNDPKRRSQEVMKLYKETGVNPLGCLGPFALQIPIMIGLFWTIRKTIGSNPEGLAGLAGNLYSWLPMLDTVVPVHRAFLWLDLGERDPTMVLPILSGVTMWIQQKMTMRPTADPAQQSTQRMMQWMMPIFFVFISITFFSGLVLYWVATNVIGIIIQYFVMGWGGLLPVQAVASPEKESKEYGELEREPGDDGEDGGGGDRDRTSRTRRRTRRGRGRRH